MNLSINYMMNSDLYQKELEIQLPTQGNQNPVNNLFPIYIASKGSSVSVDKFNYLLSSSALIPDNYDLYLNDIGNQVKTLKEISERYRDEEFISLYEEITSIYKSYEEISPALLNYKKEIELYRMSIEMTNEQIFLLTDKIKGDFLNMLKKREDQELFTIVSGLLFITLFSISATAILGRSITIPIETLRSYVLSIDLNDIKLNGNIHLKNKIDSKKHLEIYQLAESYINLENALFAKMGELEERSENLSSELKERKKAEKKLIKAEEYLDDIIQSLNSMIITTDSKLNLIHINNLAKKLSINSGKALYIRFPFLKQFSQQINGVLELSKPFFNNAIQIESMKDRYFNISISPLAGTKNKGIVIRLDDITKIRNIENQLVKTQKWETLGVLTSGFAHDFNNVLTGIVTSSSILMHKAETDNHKLDKSFINCLNIIDKSGKRAAAMVQQLLSLSRSNELIIENIDLNQSVKDIKSICTNSFDKSIDIEVELLKEKIPVKADYAQIEQSILNLCINSYHAMTDMRPKGNKIGGTLKISMNKVHIDRFSIHNESDCEPGNYISIGISDTGIGISKEQKAKIFDPFYTTKDKSKGTGLGLTMVQHIINQHNGFIELYSEVGRETIITIYLPVSEEIEVEEETIEHERQLIQGSGTILVIDDEEILRVLTESILGDCGYQILTAEDGYKGVDLYREKGAQIDLVILDMSMPGISGKETFIELKQINPEQKILMSSGFTKDERIQDLLNMGLEDFIQKPFDFIDLTEKVLKIIQS